MQPALPCPTPPPLPQPHSPQPHTRTNRTLPRLLLCPRKARRRAEDALLERRRSQVRFCVSGGDTTQQTEQWVSQEIMNSKAELLQELMMAASESNFFASAPIFLTQLVKIHGTENAQNVDFIINSFTLTGVALMCGEAVGVPVAGFCLQPTCIPSDDPDWHAIIPVDGGGLSFIENLEAGLFTSHASLKLFRSVFTDWPFSSLSLTNMRESEGLEPSQTWRAAFKWEVCDGLKALPTAWLMHAGRRVLRADTAKRARNLAHAQFPLVIPMLPDAFPRPKDWHAREDLKHAFSPRAMPRPTRRARADCSFAPARCARCSLGRRDAGPNPSSPPTSFSCAPQLLAVAS